MIRDQHVSRSSRFTNFRQPQTCQTLSVGTSHFERHEARPRCRSKIITTLLYKALGCPRHLHASKVKNFTLRYRGHESSATLRILWLVRRAQKRTFTIEMIL
jgi:hypothetical protein